MKTQSTLLLFAGCLIILSSTVPTRSQTKDFSDTANDYLLVKENLLSVLVEHREDHDVSQIITDLGKTDRQLKDAILSGESESVLLEHFARLYRDKAIIHDTSINQSLSIVDFVERSAKRASSWYDKREFDKGNPESKLDFWSRNAHWVKTVVWFLVAVLIGLFILSRKTAHDSLTATVMTQVKSSVAQPFISNVPRTQMWICNNCGKENQSNRSHCWCCSVQREERAVVYDRSPSPSKTHDVTSLAHQTPEETKAIPQSSEPLNPASATDTDGDTSRNKNDAEKGPAIIDGPTRPDRLKRSLRWAGIAVSVLVCINLGDALFIEASVGGGVEKRAILSSPTELIIVFCALAFGAWIAGATNQRSR